MASGADKREPPSPAGEEQPAAQVATEQQPQTNGESGRHGFAATKYQHYAAPMLHRIRALVEAIQNNDDAQIEEAILRLSRSRRVFAPLGFAIGAFALLFDGLRLIISNWRLTLVQIIPAMWIWFAMYDFKAHLLYGRSFRNLSGWVLAPVCLTIIAITVVSFFLNAVFAMAISRPEGPSIRPAFDQARQRLAPIVTAGVVVGSMLAFASMFAPRLGHRWFTISLGIVIGVMMISYVSLPARLIGIKPTQSTREKLTTSAIGGILGATVCTPPYLLGRLGILMLGSKALFVPGLFVLTIGVTLQAGATGAVRAIKLSTKLTARSRHTAPPAPAPPP
jgi:hypothetical protein